MEFIDDKGRIFGAINIIDALAILLVLAIIVAGIGFINPFSTTEQKTATRYATIVLGEQPRYIADLISSGDQNIQTSDTGNLTITDTYISQATNRSILIQNISVVVRAKLIGSLTGGNRTRLFKYNGETKRVGDTITINTQDYNIQGNIINLASENPRLDTKTTSLVLETTTSKNLAYRINRYDTYSVGSNSIATINSFVFYPTEKQNQTHGLIHLDLETINLSGVRYFGDTRLQIGNNIEFSTDTYTISGEIQRIDTSSIYSSRQRIQATLKLENIPPERADMVVAGMSETIGGIQTATIQKKDVEPSTITLTSESGDIFRRQHPVNKDVYLQIELTVHPTRQGVEFHGQPLQTGDRITLDLGQTTITGHVTKINT